MAVKGQHMHGCVHIPAGLSGRCAASLGVVTGECSGVAHRKRHLLVWSKCHLHVGAFGTMLVECFRGESHIQHMGPCHNIVAHMHGHTMHVPDGMPMYLVCSNMYDMHCVPPDHEQHCSGASLPLMWGVQRWCVVEHGREYLRACAVLCAWCAVRCAGDRILQVCLCTIVVCMPGFTVVVVQVCRDVVHVFAFALR
jgi:hypothetical protein